jgi:hypothetical protein
VPSSSGKVEEMLLLQRRLRLKEPYEVQGAGLVFACSATRRVAKPTRQWRKMVGRAILTRLGRAAAAKHWCYAACLPRT